MKLPKCSSDSFKREGRRGRDRRSSSHFAWRCFPLLLGQGGRSRRAGPPQDPCKLLPPPHDSCRVSLAANSEDDWDLCLKTMPEKNENKKYTAPRCWQPADLQEVEQFLQYFSVFL